MNTQDTPATAAPRAWDIRPLGDCAVRVTLGNAHDPAAPQRGRRFCAWLALAAVPGINEWVPAYTSVTVFYAPERIDYAAVCRALTRGMADLASAPASRGRLVELPVRYGGADGPDLSSLAARHGLSALQVVSLHAGSVYEVVMVGFLPGFPYLRGLPPALHTPRLSTPRTLVPAGSVGIGGAQTGVYPCESPGGWNLVGRTDTPLFDVLRDPPALLQAGDRVRFVPL